MARPSKAVGPVFRAMSLEERGLLHLVLVHGKDLETRAAGLGVELDDAAAIASYGERETLMGVVEKLEASFESGTGIVDALAGRSDDYGAQLQFVIDKVLVKSLDVSRPLFDDDHSTLAGALQRERWIAEKLLEAMWDKLPEDAKRDVSKRMEELLRRSGVDPAVAARTTAGLVTGGFAAARAILGFKFHILLAQFANGIGALSFLANAGLQRFAGFAFGPIGVAVSIALLSISIVGYLLPRRLDRYIPAVFLIGLRRLQSEEASGAA